MVRCETKKDEIIALLKHKTLELHNYLSVAADKRKYNKSLHHFSLFYPFWYSIAGNVKRNYLPFATERNC